MQTAPHDVFISVFGLLLLKYESISFDGLFVSNQIIGDKWCILWNRGVSSHHLGIEI